MKPGALDRPLPQTITGAQPSKKTGNGQHGRDVRGDDFYPTPAPLTKALMRAEALPKKLWEPCGGMGHMAAVLELGGHDVYCSDLVDYQKLVPGSPEIATGVDFLLADKAPFAGSDWAIITNPPFSHSNAIVRKGLELCETVYVLNRIAFLEGRARSDIIDGHLGKVWVFKNRPPLLHRWSKNERGVWEEWSGRKADSAMTMCWCRFDRNKVGPTTMERIEWLRSDL